MGRRTKKTILIATISGRDLLLNSPKGHTAKISGCGAHAKGPKRQRTRADRNRTAIASY